MEHPAGSDTQTNCRAILTNLSQKKGSSYGRSGEFEQDRRNAAGERFDGNYMPSSESFHTGSFTDSTERSCWYRGLWQVLTMSLLHNTPSVIPQGLQIENSVVTLVFSSRHMFPDFGCG